MEQLLISSLAAAMAMGSLFVAATEWQPAYELRSMQFIRQRFGRMAARLTFVILAAILFLSAAIIWMGIRPSYASAARRAHAIDVA